MFKTLGSGKITDPDPDNNKIILSDLSIHCSDGMQPTFNSKIYTITYSNLSNPNSSVNDFDYNLQNILSRNNWVKCFVNSTSSPSNQVYRKDGKLLQILENNSTSSQSVSISFEY